MLLTPPTPCHRLSHLLGPPAPLERDVLYGRPHIIHKINIIIYCNRMTGYAVVSSVRLLRIPSRLTESPFVTLFIGPINCVPRGCLLSFGREQLLNSRRVIFQGGSFRTVHG